MSNAFCELCNEYFDIEYMKDGRFLVPHAHAYHMQSVSTVSYAALQGFVTPPPTLGVSVEETVSTDEKMG